ncbi:hypothetical protein [Paraglaciecola marina]|uniref:hypothetical protein n=1 Tax=Paraglaciecola marina TaxID=2500157 RepID=UPI00105F186C|nr:hypothetical protein [Paraglaciecola marina]
MFTQTGNFKEFVERLPDFIRTVVHPLDGERFIKTGQKWISIDEFAFGDKGEKLVDHILPIESLTETLIPILESCNMRNLPSIPQINTTKHGHYRQYYTEKEKKIVKKIFEADFEIGKYSF